MGGSGAGERPRNDYGNCLGPRGKKDAFMGLQSTIEKKHNTGGGKIMTIQNYAMGGRVVVPTNSPEIEVASASRRDRCCFR